MVTQSWKVLASGLSLRMVSLYRLDSEVMAACASIPRDEAGGWGKHACAALRGDRSKMCGRFLLKNIDMRS